MSMPPIVYDVVLPGIIVSLAPSGTAKVEATTGMPGLPASPGASEFGTTRCVHVFPPPVCGVKVQLRELDCKRMPFGAR
jgi:hypothetical protein